MASQRFRLPNPNPSPQQITRLCFDASIQAWQRKACFRMNWPRGPCSALLTYCYVSLRSFMGPNLSAQPLLYNSALGTDGRNTFNWINIFRREICLVCYASSLLKLHGEVSDFPTPRVRHPDSCSGLFGIGLVKITVDPIYSCLCISLSCLCSSRNLLFQCIWAGYIYPLSSTQL
jgi:hypothetical protein